MKYYRNTRESEEHNMGDMVKKKTTADKIAERAARRQETVHTENETIENISKRVGGKDKPISARVNGTTYLNFKKICEARGITSNACLNMLITDFVRENKSIIEK